MAGNPQHEFDELDKRTDQLRAEFSRRSSLFDLLSPPPLKPDNPAATEDKKLRGTITTAALFSFQALLYLLIAIRFGDHPQPDTYHPVIQVLILFLGVSFNAWYATRLLRVRIVKLESELWELRRSLPAPDVGGERKIGR